MPQNRDSFLVEVAPGSPGATEKPAVGPVYRNKLARDGYSSFEGVDNLFDLFSRSVDSYADKECIGWRPSGDEPFKWLTYRETADRAASAGSGLARQGVKEGGRCAVFSANCCEWAITLQVRTPRALTEH